MKRKTALVAGANGIIGRNLVEHLRADGGWDVLGLSRRGGLAVDLLDPADTRAKVGALTGVTHLFYAAYQDRPTWAELVPPNLAMLTNLVEALDPAALEHVSLMQGYKVYGAHLGPFKTPARETDAGHMPPEFNVDQQQFLERRAGSWTWSAIRPSVVGGTALGNPMNLALAIAVYASISKELGVPLRFPGKPGAYDSLLEMTDAGLLASATVWAADRQGPFNIANGDLFRWRELWPKLAAYFDLETAPPLRMSLVDVMADKAPLWTSMAARHGLSPSYADVSTSWAFADFVFGWDYDMFADTSKSRRAGFHEYVETEQMFYRLFDEFRKARVIP
ncbi:SDR family oxidoreductase [Amycolatopsis sp. SID8362]|uniref:SDR family oxidoreductase n=1 Tax=Amycolatopsis sp. SID8362 TaxID=2690346 RepID=UPI00136EA2A1|nr:SDR family oxidoreductase [Amycolatopsis sp. SID8362]NBH11438.1 NAD-dependent epimerase/dehydratase family protein [Amycolatopsis sp. SID8362]NED48130.1 SDR family oxidoreductase [Amycolatopsis sp. SID8362]